jgi:hypothetical protein
MLRTGDYALLILAFAAWWKRLAARRGAGSGEA